MAKTGTERQRDHKQRLRKEGYVRKEIWIMPSWWPKVKALIERLKRESDR